MIAVPCKQDKVAFGDAGSDGGGRTEAALLHRVVSSPIMNPLYKAT